MSIENSAQISIDFYNILGGYPKLHLGPPDCSDI